MRFKIHKKKKFIKAHMVCVGSKKEIQRCFVAMWSFVATSDNLTGKFIIISGTCGLSNDPYQVQDLIGTTPKPNCRIRGLQNV